MPAAPIGGTDKGRDRLARPEEPQVGGVQSQLSEER